MKIELTKAEIDHIVALMDAGCKATGLLALKPEVLSVLEKFTRAVQEANTPAKDGE